MPDDLKYALADAWDGWLKPLLALLALAALVAAYLLDWLPEPGYARLLAAVLGVVAGLGPGIAGALGAERRGAAVAALVVGVVWAAAYVAPTWRLVAPGEPAAEATLAEGEDLTLAAAPDGGATLLVASDALLSLDRGRGAKDAASVRYLLKVTDDDGRSVRVRGELSRKTVGGRRGGLPDPNAKRTILHGANLHTVPWPAGRPLRVHATTIAPQDDATVTVSVLPWAFPWLWAALALGLALAGAVVVDARYMPARTRSFLPHAGGVALAFVILVRDAIAPSAPVKPLFGTLLMAGVLGAVGGALLSLVARRLIGRRPGATPGTPGAATGAGAG